MLSCSYDTDTTCFTSTSVTGCLWRNPKVSLIHKCLFMKPKFPQKLWSCISQVLSVMVYQKPSSFGIKPVQFVLIRTLISAAMAVGALGKHGASQGADTGWAANASKLRAGTAATALTMMGNNAAIPRSSFYNWWVITAAAMESLDKDASRTPKSLVPLGHIKGDMKVCSIKCPKRPCAMPQEQPLKVTLQSRVG